MKTVLCYGDSNTWGYIPKALRTQPNNRYPYDVRWTGVASKVLGPEYHLIEEALNGRTTVFDDPVEPFRNGIAYLDVALLSHAPIDLVVVMLGSNDTKEHHSTTSRIITQGMSVVAEKILSSDAGPMGSTPELLIVAPIEINENIENLWTYTYFNKKSVEKAKELPAQYKELADRMGVFYLNAADYGTPSVEDGLHMYPEGHKRLGEAIAAKIKDILG